jgi:DNA-binding transcriptional LysR family regulator
MRRCMNWKTLDFDWNRARALLVTAEEGSYSAAARALGSTQPTIGRQVAALEEELGVTLVQRVGRGLELTEAGLDLIEHLRAMGEAAQNVSLTAAGRSRSLEGLVRITASASQCSFLLPPIHARVRALHPGIQIELVATGEVRDLRKREADIALRNFRPRDPELTARKVREDPAWLYGTPAYLERIGPIETAGDLKRADLLAAGRVEMMLEYLRAMGAPLSQENFPIVTDDHLVQWDLCRAGLGLCFMMEHVGDAEPAVVRIPAVLPPVPVPMWLTTHRAVHTSRRLRAVFDLLAEGLQAG